MNLFANKADGQPSRFSFSLRGMLAALTLIAIVFGLARLSGIRVASPAPPDPFEVISTLPGRIGKWVKVPAAIATIETLGQPYRHEDTGEVVRAWLVRGHFRDVAVHTPEIAFAFVSSIEILEPAQRTTLANGNEAYTALFDDTNRGQNLRAYWTWRNDGVWSAPDAPRIEFVGIRRLSKLYAIFESPDETSEETRIRQADFIDRFMLEANRILDAPPPKDDGPLLRGLKMLTR